MIIDQKMGTCHPPHLLRVKFCNLSHVKQIHFYCSRADLFSCRY